MWPSGFGGGAARENPAASPAVLAGEGAGKVGFVRDRLVCGFGADRSPVSSRGGAGRRWPRAALLWRARGSPQAMRGRGSSSRS
jgi:hypothetical protein